MITITTKPIRRLPDVEGIADNMDEMFRPDECRPGEVIVRRGRIKHSVLGAVDSVTAYCADDGVLSVKLVYFDGNQWVIGIGKGYEASSPAVEDAIESVLGFPVNI